MNHTHDSRTGKYFCSYDSGHNPRSLCRFNKCCQEERDKDNGNKKSKLAKCLLRKTAFYDYKTECAGPADIKDDDPCVLCPL
jgi:hypothetical protein